MAKKGQRFKKYPVQIKEKAVKLYYENMLPISTISSLLSIDSKRISLWIKNYGEYWRTTGQQKASLAILKKK